MWFGNSLHPQVTTNKFHYNKFGIIKLVQRYSHKPKSQIHPNNSLSQIQNQRTKYESKNQRFTNTKYELRTNQRESHKQIQKLQCTKREQITKLQNQNQAVINFSHYSKLQPTNIKELNKERAFFSHTHSLLFSLIFHSSTMLIQET